MAESVGQIGLDLVVNQQQFNRQLGNIQNLAKKAGKTLAAAFTVKAVADFGKQCIDLGSDLAEVQNVVDVTFPSLTAKVDSFAKNAAASFGLSETMAKKFTGTFGAMSKAFGFSEKEAYNMSTTLTGLAGDVASFYNISQDEAFTKLKSVFSGETETLKDLGIVMTQSALDQYALANGFGKTTAAMTEQEKVALRYAFVQQQLALATGDFARTSDGWANQIRILSLQFDSLKASIGQGLINLFTPILKVINTLLGKLMTLANAFKSFTALLMGKKSTGASASLKNTADNASSVSKNLNSATGSAGKLNKATKKVGDTAKKAAKKISGLMGFDKINKLTEKKTSGTKGSGGSGGSGASGGGVSAGSADMGSLPKDTEEKTLKLGKGFDNLRKAIDKLKKSFGGFSKIVTGAFQWIWKNMLVPLGKWTMQKLAPKLIELLAAGLDVLTETCKALQPLWQWAWDHLFKPLAKFAGNAIIAFLDLLVKGLTALSKWISKHQGAVRAITVAFLSFKAALTGIKFLSFIGQMGGFGAAFKKLAGLIKLATVAKIKDKAETLYLNALYAKDAVAPYAKSFLTLVTNLGKTTAALVKQAAQFIINKAAMVASKAAQIGMTIATKAWSAACTIASVATKAFGIAVAFLTSPIGIVILAITALVAAGVLLWKNWDKVKKFASSIWKKITSVVSGAAKKIKGFLSTVVNFVKKNWKDLLLLIANPFVGGFKLLYKHNAKFRKAVDKFVKAIKKKVGDLAKKVVKGFTSIVDNLKKIPGKIKSFFKGKIDGVADWFGGIKDAFVDMLGHLADHVPDLSAVKEAITNKIGEIAAKVTGALETAKDWWSGLKEKASEKIGGFTSKVTGALETAKDWWSGLKEKASEKVGGFVSKVSGALETAKDWWSGLKEKAAEKVGEIGAKVKGALETAKNWWDDLRQKMIEKIGEIKKTVVATFTAIKDGAFDTVKNAWDSIKSQGIIKTLSAAKDKWFNANKSAFDNIRNSKAVKTISGYIQKNFKSLKKAWNGIKSKTTTLKAKIKKYGLDALKRKWDALKSKTITIMAKVKTAVDSIKGWINKNVIGKLNSALSKAKIFGKHPIPYLAQGGYVKANTPQLAMIGDNRHQGEVVAPEDKMIAMARKAAEMSGGSRDGEIISLLTELISVVKAKDTDVYLDGRKVTKKVNDVNNADIKAGKRPILI